jgi:hypothetical protein
MSEQELSKQEFVAFINNLPSIGIHPGTADNMRLAATKVLDFIPDNKPANEWDTRAIVHGFAQIQNLSDKTAMGYESRLRSCVKKFLAHKNGTLNIKPRNERPVQKTEQATVGSEVKTFSLPIPLRNDLILTIDKLPRDLTIEEADRIANIVKSFAISG